MEIEAYILTNGRSSFKYAEKALEAQTVPININVVRNKSMTEAMNGILKTAKSEWILKVDDDFILHPMAVQYIKETIPVSERYALWWWCLWETFTNRRIQCIKVYNRERSLKVGGFRANGMGKIDRLYMHDLEKQGYRIRKDKSIIGLHACAPWNENVAYEAIWSRVAKVPHVKSKDKRGKMKKYRTPLIEQYKRRIPVINKYNKAMKTKFHFYLQGHDF